MIMVTDPKFITIKIIQLLSPTQNSDRCIESGRDNGYDNHTEKQQTSTC